MASGFNSSRKFPRHSDFEIRTKAYYPALYLYNKFDQLPRNWNTRDRNKLIGLTSDGYLKFRTKDQNEDEVSSDSISLRADSPIPFICGIYYFEIFIQNKSKHGNIRIGLQTLSDSLKKLPGFSSSSFGYNSNDGGLYHENISLKHSQAYGEGDIVGCGVDFVNNFLFFTKNGKLISEAFKGKISVSRSNHLYPAIGLANGPACIAANFGQKAFAFQLESFISKTRHDCREKIVSKFCADDLIHIEMKNLIASYLVHHGLVETTHAFSRWSGRDVKLDLTAIKNRNLVRSKLDNDLYSDAISFIYSTYPTLFERNRELLFELKCHEFITLVCHNSEKFAFLDSNKEVERNFKIPSDGLSSPCTERIYRSKRNLTSPSKDAIDSPSKIPACTLSDDSEDKMPKLLENKGICISNSNNSYPPSPLINPYNMGSNNMTGCDGSMTSLLEFIVKCGQQLKHLYSSLEKGLNTNKLKSLLNSTFGVLAYRNPKHSPLSYLFSSECKERLITMVNENILQAQNLPSKPKMEESIQELDQSCGLLTEDVQSSLMLNFIHPKIFLNDFNKGTH